MKSPYNNIKFASIFVGICLISCFININKSFSQGFNNNEWVFGYCGDTEQNNYLSFGKGGDPIVRSLPGSIVVGADNNAIAIDPITGQKLFFSNGELVYNYDNVPIQGAPNGFDGDFEGRQTVAIGAMDYDPDGEKLFYAFYISPSGQLLYSVVDMNAPGGASANQPPLGAVTVLDQLIGPASGAITVVKSAASPSYLISFAGGNLISRSIGATQGEFTQTASQGIPFTPKAIVFNEAMGQMILIPENPNKDLLLVDFDTSTGSIGTATPISQSGSAEAIEGAAFSPDGLFVYFSRGGDLLRVPVGDLNATPSEIPFEHEVFKVYDIKIGPDGKLYYLYEEVEGGPQLIGVVDNPNEVDMDLLEIDEDPFDGTDFCGRVFPQFAPNQDIIPTVDFEWNPEEPCSNNPVQLTSLITPENYRPVSFEWTFDPGLTDEDGEPLDVDFNQEHLLIPEEATADQSITVTLTVTFADGSVVPVTKTITLKENELQANFSAQDTTVCEGACVDIGSLLEVQKGGDEGGENPNVGGGGGGGGQQENYEYFWSNRRGEGWVTDKENCVLLPGLYWVLVREEGSECYAYASIRVKIWDLPDQSNNVWYFGDGAGLDFNPDPNDPNAPVPRPVSHPRDIPAGTTTISDETGQVLFYTDGQTVWDLNGATMANGDSIGGSNLATQSVVAVPLPQDETIFYLFTTQKAEDGSNQVKFSLVDIKVDNPTGVGNVVSKDNFLFSPSTEHSAGLTSGDTTWVVFHELGNNTFRNYPVTTLGIGPPVLSSVGSAHTFGSGVGSMKFSPDGTKLAVTIQDGNCSRLEIFDFDQSTGKLTEYALLELSCNGEEVYGLEFSDDSNRVFVSYTGSAGKVEEFLIKNPDAQGEENPSACAVCFENASNKDALEACVLDTRNTLSSAGPFGALQIGPDGQIYVARPGQNVLGTINPGQGCGNSAYVEMGTSTLTGTTNLGLPSFVQNSGSSIPEPTLGGPDRLCLDPVNGAGGLFEGGGEPDIDSYFWTIVSESGVQVLTNFGGPGEEFQTLEHIFQEDGTFTVSLRVDRCGDANYFEASMEVVVVPPPPITLVDDVTLCSGTPVTLVAIDGYNPNDGLYDFEWRNAAGQLFGDENSNSIEVDEESIYTVTVSYRIPSGLDTVFFDVCPASKSVFVGPAFEFDLIQSADEVCYDETLVVFAPNTPVTGEWYYQQVGSPTRTLIGEFFELDLIPTDLPGPGLYEIIFITEDPIVPGCLVEKKLELLVNPLPNFNLFFLTDADDCATPNGSFEITMLLDADRVEVLETGDVFNNVSAGQVLTIPNLEPGIFTVKATNNGCEFSKSVTIKNLDPPINLEYNVGISPEICGPDGVENGAVIITFSNGPQTGSYVLTRQGDGQQFLGTFPSQDIVTIPVPEGDYAVEVSDALGCTLPEPINHVVDERFQVDFTVPTDLTACGLFSFTPQTNQALVFTLTDAAVNGISPDANGEFTLLTSGTYQIIGEDPSGIDCPRVRTMIVDIIDPIVFSVSGPADPCAPAISYEAILNGTDPADVFFFWRNESGAIVGRNQTFSPAVSGDYSLDVQPRAGSLCPAAPIDFTVEDFGEPVNVVLDALPFCGDDPFTTITIVADLTNVASIQWFSIQGGSATLLQGFDDQQTITVTANGVYQAVLFSGFGCELGRQLVQITKSFITPPVLETRYVICTAENVINVLDPGVYDNYLWELEGEQVAKTQTFTPTLPGNYALTVNDEFDCVFTVEFVVEEDCELRIVFPNAIRPSDPSKHFIVFANDFIDHVDVLIYNRWGELIYFCEGENVQGEEVLCTWDGTVGGRVVPIGTYPVIVRFTSENQNIVKTLRKSIVVIE